MTVMHSASTDGRKDAVASWDDVPSIATKHPVALLHMLRNACGVLEGEPMMWDICRGRKGSYCLDWGFLFLSIALLLSPFPMDWWAWIDKEMVIRVDMLSTCGVRIVVRGIIVLWDLRSRFAPLFQKNANNLLNNNKIPLLTTDKNLETFPSLLTQRNSELPFWLNEKHIHKKYTQLRQPCDMGFPHSIRKSFAPNNLSRALISSHLSCLNFFCVVHFI